MPQQPIARRPIRIRALVISLLVPILLAAGGARSDDTPAALRASMFRAADAALSAANDARAGLLAPGGYGRAADLYRRAESTLESGGSIDSIQRNLTQAESLFRAAADAAQIAERVLATPLRARERAQFAAANRYAEAEWRAAEQALVDAAARLERGREKSALTTAERATTLFEGAELAAIKGNYLQQTRNLLARADKLKARRLAPLSYERANNLLEQAEAALNSDRYDTDRPRNLAQMAERNAYQAVYIAELESRIRSRDTSLEQIVIDWQTALNQVADLLEVPVYFDSGPDQAVTTITRAINSLQADLGNLNQDLLDRNAQIAELQQELGGKSESLERVNQLLARQERQRARIAAVEGMFSSQQANVLRQGDSVIVRLIGLNFASGSAGLGAEQQGLLALVRNAIAEFPESNIIIEGHTDSFGSDAANQQLSQARADAVQRYLLANAPISPGNITALGYGESRPVASNETPDGRRRNRRIDVIIHPRW